MHHRWLEIAIASALLPALAGAACSVQDVVVAHEVGGNMDGPCLDSYQCNPVAYCAKPSCGAREGRCELRPVACEDGLDAACGCDGVNYWNDCLRRQTGASASAPGECSSPSCGGFRGMPCQLAGAYCARLFIAGSGMCDPATPGACWVLPPQCPTDDGGALWQSCFERQGTCVDICEAIRAERPYRMSLVAPSCP
jgi:hypothetical protein